MGLLIPSSGTLFWMIIIFGVVFFILAKYQRGNQLAFGSFGIKTLENCWLTGRQIEAARQANEQLTQVKAESERLLMQAREEQAQILKEAVAARDRIIREAQARAQEEARKALTETRQQIVAEKESAINDIRRQVAMLSVDVAEKILRKDLTGEKEHVELIERLLDEMIRKPENV